MRSEVKTKVVKARRTLVDSPVAESERFAVALEAVRALDRAASKGILHRRNASRRKSRLAKQMAKLAMAPGVSVAAGGAPVAGTKGRGKKAVVAGAPAAKQATAKAGTAKKGAAPK